MLRSSLWFRIVVGGVLAVAPITAQAQADHAAVADRVAEWYRNTVRSAPGQWGIVVADHTGDVLWSVNADQPMVPASMVKLFTTGYARTVLGGFARRPTRVTGHGWTDQTTGTWTGDWALELNGDPSLELTDDAGPTLYDLALQLASAGIRKLHGPLNVLSASGPATAEYPAVWSTRHQGRLFAPLIGALTLHENVVWFTVKPGASGSVARLADAEPAGIGSLVTMKATTVRGRRSRLILREREDGGWIISGTIGTGTSPQRLSAVTNHPKAVLQAVWAAALQRAGIEWDRSPVVRPASASHLRILAEVNSAPLDSLAMNINRRSLNLGAELLLRWAGGSTGGPELLTEHVQQITGQTEGVHLVDGSGLSYDNRATPRAFANYLAKFPTTEAGRNFPQLLPANGTGTLRRLSTGLPEEGVVRAKTGTLNRTATVSGYLGRPDGMLILSLMYSGDQTWAARQAQWKLFRILGANGVAIPTDGLEPPMYQLGGDSTSTD